MTGIKTMEIKITMREAVTLERYLDTCASDLYSFKTRLTAAINEVDGPGTLTAQEAEAARLDKLKAVKMVKDRTGLPLKDCMLMVNTYLGPA